MKIYDAAFSVGINYHVRRNENFSCHTHLNINKDDDRNTYAKPITCGLL